MPVALLLSAWDAAFCTSAQVGPDFSLRTFSFSPFHETLISIAASHTLPRRVAMRAPDHPTLIQRMLQARLDRVAAAARRLRLRLDTS